MPSDPPVLAVRGVHKTFDDGTPVRAVRGATLTLGPGEFAVIVGPSGCGKTTLFALIAGLEVPDEGEIVVGDLRVDGCTEATRLELRRRHLGILTADHRLLRGLSLLDNVALAATVAGATRDAAEGRAHDALDLVGLGDAWRSLPAEVAPDQRQRAALARALVNRPTLLLADEPTARLDTAGRRDVVDLLALVHQAGQSILLATHDGEVAASAGRNIAMRDGCVDERVAPTRLPNREATELAEPAELRGATTEPADHGRVAL